MLGEPETKVGQRTVDGIRCYVVEQTKTVSDVRWRTEYLISPRQSHLAVGLTYERDGRRYFAHRLFDLHEAEPGLWVPGRIVSGNEPDRDGKFRTYDLRRSMRVVRYEPSRKFAEEDFRLKVPLNADVTDLALGTSYCNDPWWPEIGKLLRDRFDWPKADLSPLKDLETYGNPPIVGRPAPPIEASLLDQLGAARLAEASRQGGAGRLHGPRRAEQVDPRPAQAAREPTGRPASR